MISKARCGRGRTRTKSHTDRDDGSKVEVLCVASFVGDEFLNRLDLQNALVHITGKNQDKRQTMRITLTPPIIEAYTTEYQLKAIASHRQAGPIFPLVVWTNVSSAASIVSTYTG